MSMLDSFIYSNFTGDLDDPDYYLNHPDPEIRSRAVKSRDPSMLERDMHEVADETGIPVSSLASVDPYDPRWSKFRSRSAELHEDHEEQVHSPAHEQQAFKEIFG